MHTVTKYKSFEDYTDNEDEYDFNSKIIHGALDKLILVMKRDNKQVGICSMITVEKDIWQILDFSINHKDESKLCFYRDIFMEYLAKRYKLYCITNENWLEKLGFYKCGSVYTNVEDFER